MAEIVRTPIGPDARLSKRRTLEERIMVRWPGAWKMLSQAVNRLDEALREIGVSENAAGVGQGLRG